MQCGCMLLGEARSVGEKLFERRGDYDGEDECSAVKATIAGDWTIVLKGGGSVEPLGQEHMFLDSKRDNSSLI